MLSLLGTGAFEVAVSVPLVLEYEEVAKRVAHEVGLSHRDVDNLLDYVCQVSDRRQIFFLWRPWLKDQADDLVLEVAVEANCGFIVTHNTRDFIGVERFGVRVVTPQKLLRLLGAIK